LVIISIHLPKTAGTSFGELLKGKFGPRLMLDYGDWSGYNSPEATAHRARRMSEMRGRREEIERDYDVIHGHFIADKYEGLFSATRFVAFFRDPYQQAISNYIYLKNNPVSTHPAVKIFHDAKMSIIDYLSWDAVRDPQSAFLGGVPIDALTVVGLTEQFSRGLALFRAILGRDVSGEVYCNVNPARRDPCYEIGPDVKKAVETHRQGDIELYRRARDIFRRQAARWGV
jgi:hypothetical protein